MKLSKSESKIMDALRALGTASVREVQEALAGPPLAYTTVQTMIYRLEAKGAVRRVKKVGNAHVFEPVVDRDAAEPSLVDRMLGLFGGSARPLLSHLVETGKLTEKDLREAERMVAASRNPGARRTRKRGEAE